jgi:hypothetical protein
MSTQKVSLTRVLPGYYSWNSSDYKISASVIKSEKNWTVELSSFDLVFVNRRNTQLFTAKNLDEARSIIESFQKEN